MRYYLIYILFFKAKFDGQTLKIQVYVAAGPMGGGKLLTTEGDEVVLKKFGGDLFAPKNACTRSVSGIRVTGKTGTAANAQGKDHAWFIGSADVGGRKIAFAIIVENSGGGGIEAAPIARKIVLSME